MYDDKKYPQIPVVTDSFISPRSENSKKPPKNNKVNYLKYVIAFVPITVIMIGVMINTYLVKQNQDIRSRAGNEAYAPNSELLTLRDSYTKINASPTLQQTQSSSPSAELQQKTAILEDMKTKAQARKTTLLDELKNSPGGFLSHATLATQRSTFPTEVQPFIEEEKTLDGKVAVEHSDNFESQIAKAMYTLTSNSRKTQLYFTNIPEDLSTGDTLQAQSLGFDNNYLVTQVNTLTQGTAPAFYSGQKKMLLILVNFNQGFENFTPQQAKNFLFTDPKNVSAFYKENSNNTLSFTGDVTNWITLNTSPAGCNLYNWENAALEKAAAAGYNTNNFDVVGFHFSVNGVCPFAGVGGGNNFAITLSFLNGYVYTHEVGHTTPVHHASTIDCGIKAIDTYANCTFQEYGDPTDVMGHVLDTFNAPHKIAAGWKTSTGTATVNGNYTITSNGFTILKRDTGEIYYLSYRQTSAFDTYLPIGFTKGVGIHVWNGNAWTQTKLVDTTPQTDSFDDAALSDGTVFYDAINRIKITQLSHGGTSASVRVEFNVDGASAPQISTTSLPAGLRGQPYTAFVLAADADRSDILSVTITGLPNGLTYTCTDVARITSSKSCRISGTFPAIGGNYDIVVRASDNHGLSVTKHIPLTTSTGSRSAQ